MSTGTMTNNGFTYVFLTLLTTSFVINSCEAFPWFWDSDDDTQSDEPSTVSNSWKVGDWNACSKSCGTNGTQSRTVVCQTTSADGVVTLKEDSDCTGPKPDVVRPCSADQPCPEWQPTPWSDCSRQCDEGSQTREVVCIVQLSNRRKHPLPEAQCDISTKPATSQTCNNGPCSAYEWISSDWSGCHHPTCEIGVVETRVVMCVNMNGDVAETERCDKFQKPATTRSCVVQNTCKAKPQWHATQWAPCSARCGSGTQQRKVLCAVAEGTDHLRRRPSEECDPATRMTDIQDCQGHNCSAVWFTGLYGKCSEDCDGGERKRAVMCVAMASSRQVADSECDATSRPVDVDHCNQQPCNAAAVPGSPLSAVVKEATPTSVLLDIEAPLDNGGSRLIGYDVFHEGQHYAFTLDDPFFIGNLRPGYSYEFTIRARSEVGLGQALTLAYKMPETGASSLDCHESEFGCCPDGVTPADGPHQHGCLHRDRVPEGIECAESQYGCCSDGTTAATGPNGKGCEDDQDGSSGDADSTALCSGLDCQQSATCSDAMYGCCPDGTTSATGPDFEGCSDVHAIPCEELAYGCCPDGSTPAIDSDGSNCPSDDEGQDCSRSTYGCCSDGVTFALGPDFEGCASPKTVPCEDLVYGCCPDGTTPAVDHEGTNCPQEVFEEPVRAVVVPTLAAVTVLSDCHSSEFGCCPDGQTSAQGPGGSGCGSDCASSMYGCCLDGVSVASGVNFEGCSEQMASGEQAACADSTYGCCPDGTTSALGPHESGCPSKIRQGAYCKTPSESSVCGEYEVKWFFDSAVGICTRAWYSGCDIDAHHFDNEEDCQASCVSPSGLDKCYLPASVGRCRASATRYFYNATSRRCQTFVYGGCDGNANNFNDIEECQQSCEQPLSPDVCSQPVTTGPCRGSYERFYFDSETKSCMTFNYGGCRGNDNRFPTIEACENRCKRSQSVHDVCDLPKETGRCRAAMSMWYYNSQIGECQQFTYGGCDGNGNRFATRLECENTCSRGGVAKERKDTCALPQDSGPCRGYFERWYFDSKDRTCKQFVYGGCHGNDNRFDTEAACRSACNALPPTDVCSLPSDQGPCYDYVLRHFYDQTTNRCEYFYYGGCEGNDNNFGSAEECEKRCTEPETEHAVSHDTCSLSMDVGPCSRSLQRWYYSVTEQRCREFTYGGCQGNGNRFTTEEECERQCGGRLDSEIGRRTSQPDDTHVRHSAADAVCLLERDSGTCDDPRALWYFDSSSQVCRRFLYSGCGGNGNRFETEEECSARCLGNRNDEDNDSVRPESLISAPGIHASERTDESHCVDFRGYVVANGERYNPHQDPCLVCTCHHGRDEHCMISHCQPPDCDWVPIEGQCCKFHCRNGSSTTSSSTDDEPGEIVDEPCSDDICEHQCPYGFVQSSDGCKSCRCHQPCKKLECSHSFDCQLQNVYCDTALCADGTTACHQPVTEIGEIKSGLCPRSDILHQPSSQCNDDCYSDQECAGTYRCCETSCGGRTCMPTVGSISSADDLVEVRDHVQASIPAVVDETVSMPCRNGKTAGATIRWYHDRMLLPDDPAEEDGRLSVQPDGTLVLSGVSEDDNSVTYTCLLIVDNDLSSAVAHTHAIDIQDPPRFTDDQETHRSLAPAIGATVQLDCPVDGNPLPVITWHKDGHVIYEGRNHIFQKGETILIIRQVQQSDGGNYECEAYNGIGGSLVRAFTIEPLIDSSYHRPLEQSSGSGLRFTDDQSEYRTLSPSLGSTVRLDCPVQDIHTALVTWLKNDYPVDEDNNVIIERDGLALVIYRLQFSDGGNYECRVQNRAGDSLHRIFVVEPLIEESVYDPLGHGTPSSSTARMTFTDDQSSHQSLGPALGSTVQLECPVAVTPPPRISWMKDGVVIGSESNHVLQNGGMVFVIRNLQDSDGGNYECEVTNSVGETLHRTFTVEPLIEQDVYKPLYPQPPTAATAGSSNRRRLEARILAEKHEVSVGDTVRLECRTTHGDGDDDVEVTWSLNDQPLSSSADAVENHLKFEGFHLVIEKVVKADEGTYVCRAQSSADDVAVNSDPFKLDVIAVAVPSDCVDKPWYANCALIVEAQMCRHPYFSVFCCNSCYAAGLLP